MERTVLVSGASTGIGEATALRLDRAGMRVIAGVRREADAERLAAKASARLRPVLLDVTDGAGIDAAAETVAGLVGVSGLHGLVNNAGISGGDPLEFMDADTLRGMLEVNVVGGVRLLQSVLPHLRSSRGRVVWIGSIGGRTPVPFTSAYSASKAAVAAVCDCLRLELRPWGIGVVLVEPGSVRTPIWDKGLRDFDARRAAYPEEAHRLYGTVFDRLRAVTERTGRAGIDPDRVARVVEQALTARRPPTRRLVGPDARAQAVLRRLPDRLRDRAIAAYLKLPAAP